MLNCFYSECNACFSFYMYVVHWKLINCFFENWNANVSVLIARACKAEGKTNYVDVLD